MKLQKLLRALVSFKESNPDFNCDITRITCDSRDVIPGSLFVAISGTEQDGHDYIDDAISRGARCVICERDVPAKDVPTIGVPDAREAQAYLAAAFFGHPSKSLKTIGITGTNGKTTITFLLAHIIRSFSRVGFLSTICYDTGKEKHEALHTTPPAFATNKYIARMRENRCDYCVMEVSSHALSQKRVAGLEFDAAIFSNLTHEHLDYHKTVENYFAEKQRLFSVHRPRLAIINADDPYGERLIRSVSSVKAHTSVLSYGIMHASDVRATDMYTDIKGTRFTIAYMDKRFSIESGLVCRHNMYNILAACAYALSCGFDCDRIAESVKTFPGVKGRLERIDCRQPFNVFIDYAHTPDAFLNVLGSIRSMTKCRIITVFGCGGDRDRDKRPLMGRLAAEYSDYVFVTNDNPRNEDEYMIVRDIENGIKGTGRCPYAIILDRRTAICAALREATDGDCVLILGKGHEEYVIKNGKKEYFSDRECVESYFQSCSRSAQEKV
jgi:UDP-N-acetylmuramoyl-L-alanyl-D-glutamate--2,6-diaminopimelate ligase